MLKAKMEAALNEQVNAEWYSAYLYKSMSAYFKSINLEGFANWMEVQNQEEMFHGNKIYNYIDERGGRITLTAIDAPPTEWKSPLDVIEATYKHEQLVTEKINNLMDLAIAEKDHASQAMLHWFVEEQVEEEANVDGILQRLKMVKGDGNGLFMIDKELSARVFTPPATEE